VKGPGNWKNRKQKLLTESKSVNSRYFAWRREKSKEKKKKSSNCKVRSKACVESLYSVSQLMDGLQCSREYEPKVVH